MPGEKFIQTANIWHSCNDYVIFAGLLWWISPSHRRVSKLQRYQQMWKKLKLKYGIVASTFNGKRVLGDKSPESDNLYSCLINRCLETDQYVYLGTGQFRSDAKLVFWEERGNVISKGEMKFTYKKQDLRGDTFFFPICRGGQKLPAERKKKLLHQFPLA